MLPRKAHRYAKRIWDELGNLLQNQEIKILHIFSALACFKLNTDTRITNWDLAARIMTINADVGSWGFSTHLRRNTDKYTNLIRYIDFSLGNLGYLSGARNDTSADEVSHYDPIVKELISLMVEALKDIPCEIEADVNEIALNMKLQLKELGKTDI
ncbi:hypothetical protein PULV_a3927 [Pseudoalteromonas ulvae UL12]|nr:hypothetical protein [Pseudoalteromonas ulvae UL12]